MKKIILYFVCVLLINQFTEAQENFFTKGKAELTKGEYSQAVKTYSELITNSPDNAIAWLGRGEAYYNLNKYDQALKNFNMAQSLESNISSLWISRCYAMKSDPVKSLEALENHLRSPYKLSEKEILLDPAFRKIEKTKEWRSFWKNDWYKPFDQQKADVAYQIQKGNYNKAIEELNILLNQNEDDAKLYYLRSLAYKNNGEENKSVVDLNIAINKDPDNIKYRKERAVLYTSMDRQEAAVKDYSEIIKNHPDDFRVYLDRAEVFLDMRKYNQALLDTEFYLGYFERDHEAQYFAGWICYKSGKYHNAVKYFNKALDLEQGSEKYFIARGNTYIKMNTFEQAINDFSMALDLNPTDAEIYFNRGIARLKFNRPTEACYDFRKAFEMGKREALEYLQTHCSY